jgi:hypothetical protein
MKPGSIVAARVGSREPAQEISKVSELVKRCRAYPSPAREQEPGYDCCMNG